MKRWSRRRQVVVALDEAEAARTNVEHELSRTREAYDRALAESGVVLVQQVAPGVDGYHVSASVATVLGWDPLAFLAPGILRGMVHPDDLGTFALAFPVPTPHETTDAGPVGLPPLPLEDSTPDPTDGVGDTVAAESDESAEPTADALDAEPDQAEPDQAEQDRADDVVAAAEPPKDTTTTARHRPFRPGFFGGPSESEAAEVEAEVEAELAAAAPDDETDEELLAAIDTLAAAKASIESAALDGEVIEAAVIETTLAGDEADVAQATPVIDLTGGDTVAVTGPTDRAPALVADDDDPEGARGNASEAPADELVVRFRTAAGTWSHLHLRPTQVEPGAVLRGSMVDVSSDEAGRRTGRRFAELVELDPAGCLIVEFLDASDPATLVIRAANRAAHAMFRLEHRVVDGTPIESVLGPASAQLLRSAVFDVSHTGESMTAERLSLNEVRGTYLDLRVDRLSDGTIGVVVEDVTGTVALEDRLRHQASHDALTALPTRPLFEERLSSAVAEVSASSPVALILVDVDRLRDINESHGLHIGDQLLVEIGRRLVREVRGTSIVSRIDGDEFAILTMPCASAAEATERAAAVSAVLDRPFDVEGHLLHVQASVGVVLAPDHAEDARSALRLAQSALERAKTDERRFVLHESDTPSSSIHRLALLSELRQGLANRDLELRYQPVVDLRSGRVDRVEAVVRWRRDEDSSRLPVEFLELAEQSGLIQPLTRWILSEAAAAAQSLAHRERPVVVSTNLSVRNLFDPDLPTFLELLVSSGELDPATLELELGETELTDDPIRAGEVLGRLAELGLKVVVDDFGTGFTSLATIRHLPLSGLKIDRSFVANITSVPADAAIVRSTIELCHELGLTVGADGIDDAETVSMLAGFGCDHVQGTHLSGPVPLEQLAGRIDELEGAVRGWIGTTESAARS